MTAQPGVPEARLRELRARLDLLARQLTRRAWANPRQMQVEAGAALSLLYGVDLPNADYLARTLAALVRELGGRRRPDSSRFLGTLESFIEELDARLGPPPSAG